MHIKRFIDRVSNIESRQGKDVVIPLSDARGLRDELAKLLGKEELKIKLDGIGVLNTTKLQFENEPTNKNIVYQRKRLWKNILELKNNEYFKKFILF